ncbi:MAG: DUF305 domain-containing protein [Chloroflexota bacterium]|nr:DUF305 domain-containing protein [Chloroflexota bacterium]
MRRHTFSRPLGAALLFALAFSAPRGSVVAVAQPDATPTTYSCETAATPMPDMSTPMAGTVQDAMDMGTPAMSAAFDQMYIDMMMPHHESIVAMAQAALDRLEDDRLRQIAQRIIDAQLAEMDELRGYRNTFYGDGDPMPMNEQMMGMMTQMMPGMGSMEEMAMQMDATSQVAAICEAEDADLAFIDLTIPHHVMAIAASEAAREQATHDEIRAFAERVIEDQQREIEELQEIRMELYGSATPEPVGA